MKRITTIGFLIIALTFQDCKNNKTPQDTLEAKDTQTAVEQDIENTETLDTIKVKDIIKNDVEIESNKNYETPKKIEEEINKDADVNVSTKKEDVATIIEEADTEKEEIVKKEILETMETVEVKETETEEVVEVIKEVEPEPIIEKPETASSSKNWVVPAKYEKMKNPTDPKVDIAIGKSLYAKHCKSCHGKEGSGDGPKADEQNGDLGDFSSTEFQAQSDGALFYKTTIGRDDMPEYTKKIPDDEDRWLIVNYMRTLRE